MVLWPLFSAAVLGGVCLGDQGAEPPSVLFGTAPPFESGEPEGPSLGFILGIFTIIVTIIYIIGISFKVMKIYRGEYEPTEPVYLKYK